ncbi:MAG: Oxidoreductase molybdopterin binding [Phycisphaerales bacterium]|nr:Oxidoreductase molybdopterin binding [Phycisphaerales bacterium]
MTHASPPRPATRSEPARATWSRRQWMKGGLAAAGVWAVARLSPTALGLAEPAAGDVVVPFLDAIPDPKKPQVRWADVPDQWLTPDERVYEVSHYPKPPEAAAEAYRLTVGGLVDKPLTLTLADLKARPRRTLTATLECGGNGSNAGFMGAVANATWTGTPLLPLLAECGLKPAAVEVAFYGADVGKEKVRNFDVEQPFARTLPVTDLAGRTDVLLCDEMNGKPLTPVHGAPVRLVVPGWYGIAWVKWLTTIEARDRRLMTRFVAKDYVTLRVSDEGGRKTARETSVGPLNVKSIAARVVRRPDGTHVVSGAAWTQGKVAKVELKIDGGAWAEAALEKADTPHAWTFWHYEWKGATPGEHALVSRATDAQGRVQPAADDPEIKDKRTYWEAYAQYPRRVRVG